MTLLNSFIRSEHPWETPRSSQAHGLCFSKSISVSQLVAVPLKSSGSHTSPCSRLPAASSWKMELSGLEGYMYRDSLTQPFVWLRWIQPDSNTVSALQRGLHYGHILPDTHCSQDAPKLCSDTLHCMWGGLAGVYSQCEGLSWEWLPGVVGKEL